MLNALLSAAFTFLFTAVFGTWIANRWREQSAKETRFFEASKDIYNQMSKTAETLTTLIGRRLYASQRLSLLSTDHPDYDRAKVEFKDSVADWNNRLMELELSTKSLFRNSRLEDFELLQADLATITRRLVAHISLSGHGASHEIYNGLKELRYRFFQFAKAMLDEAKTMHRQMHFGVRLEYNEYQIESASTLDLLKQLFVPYKKGHTIVRSPGDFGVPVSIGDARFGINE